MSKSRTTFKVGVGFALAVLGSVMVSTTSFAQQAPAAGGKSCFLSPAKLSDAEVSSFLGQPDAILTEFATAGLPMSTRVRSLAGSSIDTVDPLLALIPTATKDQKSAIGAGLARAAKACEVTDPAYAALIQQKMLGVTDPDVLTAFLASSNEVQTAALGSGDGAGGGGGTGGAAGIGGGGTGGGSSGGQGGDNSASTDSGSYSIGGGSYSARNVNSRTN